MCESHTSVTLAAHLRKEVPDFMTRVPDFMIREDFVPYGALWG